MLACGTACWLCRGGEGKGTLGAGTFQRRVLWQKSGHWVNVARGGSEGWALAGLEKPQDAYSSLPWT